MRAALLNLSPAGMEPTGVERHRLQNPRGEGE
jgi:hypothetical protein